LINDPSIIMGDEPTGNLDSENGTDVIKLIQLLNDEGTTVIMVTHSNYDAGYAGRIIRLLDGKIVEDENSNTVINLN